MSNQKDNNCNNKNNCCRISKKRIKTSKEQEKRIKFLLKNGCSHQIIADDLDLPVGVIKRFDKTEYFKISEMPKGYYGTKGNDSDLDFFLPECRPSELIVD